MTETIQIGEYTITALEDGESHLPASAYPGADFSRYPHLLDSSGTHRIRIGAHLVRGPVGTFLVDAGAGELSMPFPAELATLNGLDAPPPLMAEAGRLPDALERAGVTPEEITAVFITHLHLDHAGWIMREGAPYFPGAVVRYGAEDWGPLVEQAPEGDPLRAVMLAADDAGILRPYETPTEAVLPGVTASHTPGHTPGHRTIELASGRQRIVFAGDLLELPVQASDRDVHFMTDVDRDAAGAARSALVARAKAEGIVVAPAHFTSPTFGLIADDGSWVDAAAR